MKLCKDCIHYHQGSNEPEGGIRYIIHYCRQDSKNVIDPVDGEQSPPPTVFCRDSRRIGPCYKDGVLFSPANPAPGLSLPPNTRQSESRLITFLARLFSGPNKPKAQ